MLSLVHEDTVDKPTAYDYNRFTVHEDGVEVGVGTCYKWPSRTDLHFDGRRNGEVLAKQFAAQTPGAVYYPRVIARPGGLDQVQHRVRMR